MTSCVRAVCSCYIFSPFFIIVSNKTSLTTHDAANRVVKGDALRYFGVLKPPAKSPGRTATNTVGARTCEWRLRADDLSRSRERKKPKRTFARGDDGNITLFTRRRVLCK